MRPASGEQDPAGRMRKGGREVKKLLWVACASGIGLLGGTMGNVLGQSAADPGAQVTPPAEARPVRARTAMLAGIEFYKKADYEQAEMKLKQAEMGQSQLTDDEKGMLAKYLQYNGEGLRGRRAGEAKLGQAEQLLKAGKVRDAEALVKELKTNKYLSAKDNTQLASLSGKMPMPC
jgi:hypothetical protein